MRKFKLASIALLLVLSLCISPVYAAGITIDGPINSDDIISVSVISDTLREYLAEADENELVPVTIQLNDDIDLEEVEQLAITRAELSSDELAIMSVETSALSEEENETHQIAAMAVQDKIAVERNEILKEHYNNKNSEFITSFGLSESQIGSVGIFTPFIRDVLLTPTQIRSLAVNPNVCYIDYLGSDKGADFDTIDGPINSDDIISVSVISDTLREYLAEADENELVPVTIQLNDDIDLEEVEQLAITRAELSSDELAIMSVETSALSEEENETQQIYEDKPVNQETLDTTVSEKSR